MLATSQALALSAVVLPLTLAGIPGAAHAPDKGLATLPIAAMVVGTAIASIPASMLMRHLGWRARFLIGAAFGIPGTHLTSGDSLDLMRAPHAPRPRLTPRDPLRPR